MNRLIARAFLLTSLIVCGGAMAADPVQPVTTDSRIKTFVYNENDVFALDTYYGYQCNIELGLQEEVETISVGDRAGWQIVPSGRRLFIRPLEPGLHTNMTVVTSQHAYQFDLSSGQGESKPPRDLAYVVRFYYPQEDAAQQGVMLQSSDLARASGGQAHVNLNYTYSGSDAIAPLKIYDDGRATYFKFAPGSTPSAVSMVRADGAETPVPAKMSGGYLVVPGTARQFVLRQGALAVTVYNEGS